MINEIDLNGDGQICFEEFKTMMNNVILKDKNNTKLIDGNCINRCNTFPYNIENVEKGFKVRYDINDTFNESRDAKKTVIMFNKKIINKKNE